MRLKIKHETHFALETSARRALQYLRMTPRNDRNQRVGSWNISGPDNMTRWLDGFGNIVYFAAEQADHEELIITVEGEVETIETNGVLPLDDGLPPPMFLRPTPLVSCDEAMTEFADQFGKVKEKEGTIPFLHALMNGLADEVTYESGHSTVHCKASDVFKKKKGVCQDFAHLFIGMCHEHKVPARYVSGYVVDGAGEPASHAWAESFVPDLGWVSFDPSNRQSATEGYVRLAVAYDYSGAAPMIGVRTGGEGEKMSVKVQVVQLQN